MEHKTIIQISTVAPGFVSRYKNEDGSIYLEPIIGLALVEVTEGKRKSYRYVVPLTVSAEPVFSIDLADEDDNYDGVEVIKP